MKELAGFGSGRRMTLVAADSEPELAGRLTRQHLAFLEAEYPICGSYQAKALRRQRDAGGISLLLWKRPAAGHAGLVWLEAVPSGDRIHGLWVEPLGVAGVEALLEDVERERRVPVAAVSDLIPAVGPGPQQGYFEARGFWHREKVLMRRPASAGRSRPSRTPSARVIRPHDLRSIVDVYLQAYAERPGEFWTWNAPAARNEAERDVMGHLDEHGGWVPNFLADASFVWEDGGRVVGAILVETGRNGVPFVEDLIVEPTFQRRGIGGALLENALDRISGDDPKPVELAAIRFGAPYKLYRRLGFEEVPPPNGRLDGHWIRGRSPL
jgi:predicted N-acetyltransferase YhbS